MNDADKRARETAVATLLEEDRRRRPVDEHRLAELEVAAADASRERERVESAVASDSVLKHFHDARGAREAERSAESALASARADFEKTTRLRAEAEAAETLAANRAMADASQAAARASSDAARWAKVAAIWTAVAALATLASVLVSAWLAKQ